MTASSGAGGVGAAMAMGYGADPYSAASPFGAPLTPEQAAADAKKREEELTEKESCRSCKTGECILM
jgi:hypothetical protein